MKLTFMVLKLQNEYDFQTQNYKGYNSVNNVDGVTIPVLCTSSEYTLYLYQVLWEKKNTLFILEIAMGQL